MGKEYIKAVYCHPAYLTHMQSTGWKKHKLESRLLGEISITSDMQMTPRLWQKEELKSLLMKQEHEKVGIKVNIHKTKIMASGPITPWQIDGETVETLADFIFLGSVITADGDFRHEIKRHLLLGRKTMTKLNNILKSRDITLATKVCLVKIMFFSSSHVWLWESIKKAECQRIGAFELWCWRRLLGIPWTARIFNQSIIKEISPEYSLEGLNIHWKDWCWNWSPTLWPPHVKSWLTGKDPDAGKGWGQEEKGMTEDEVVGCHHWLSEHEFEQAMGVGDEQASLACCHPWGHKELDMPEWLNWTESFWVLCQLSQYCSTCV